MSLALTLALVGAGPAASGGRPDTPQSALGRARATADRLTGKAEAIRMDLGSGSFDRAVGRLADMAGLTADVARTTPAMVPLPAGLGEPIGDLLAAATEAARRVERAVALDGGKSLRLSKRANALGNTIADALLRGNRWPVKRARTLRERILQSPILDASADGGRTIAAALDRSLPALRDAAAALPVSTVPAAACDVLDQRPALCINGTGPNAIDAEAVLVVDLGGDDTYTSSAGSASSARCVDDPDDASCQASVLIDLGGDDTYNTEQAIRHGHLVGAGSAMTGVGVLVDVAGNDRYLADLSKFDGRMDMSFGLGSAQLGLGLLADLTGDDLYQVTGEPDHFELNQYYMAASLTGMGGLLDFDGANTYRSVIRGFQSPVPGSEFPPMVILDTMAVGVFGGAALYDRTGYATFDARVEATADIREERQSVGTIAHGVGLIGHAALFAGPGPTTYSAISQRVAAGSVPGQSEEPPVDEWGVPVPTGRLPGSSGVNAQGVGALGTGIIDDLGGDDTYLAHSRAEHRFEVVAEPGCGCDRAIATLDVTSWNMEQASSGVSAQALGSSIFAPDAGALINDHAGDDTYVVRAEQVISTRAENRLSDPSGGARAEMVPGRVPQVTVFGQGMGSDAAPSVLLDRDGQDLYELVSLSTTDASADAGEGPESARSVSGTTQTVGQGASYFDPAQGTLMDLGGRDEYRAHAISRATTDPNPGAWESTRDILAQGAIGGLLADIDQGIADRFEATPEGGTGAGVRGEGPGWIDTSRTFPGFGVAPLQPAKEDVTVTMAADNPSSADGGWVRVRARLLDGGGAPLAGQEVTFDIERRFVNVFGDSWTPHYLRAHGITDEEGWATGYLDADEYREYHSNFGDVSTFTLRIAARFHGTTEHRAAITSHPFAITG